MSFAQPWLLLGVVVVLVALSIWLWAMRGGSRRARAVTRESVSGPRYLSAALLTCAALSAVVAAAQPRWGEREASIPRSGSQVIFVIDVSRSMASTDVAPSRLEATKAAIETTLRRLGGDRVGLVIFAGSARIRFPLTADLEAARQVVRTLEPGPVLVQGGTSAASGLVVALAAFDAESDSGRLLVLVSDGDDLGADPAGAVTRIAASGVELIVAGVGTAAGGTIPIFDGRTPTTTDKRDANGVPIVTRLNETFLRALAVAAGGRYVGSDVRALPGAIEGRVTALKRSEFDSQSTTLPIERYPWFAGAAIVLLVLGSVFERVPRPRLRPNHAFVAAAVAMLFMGAGCATRAHDLNEEGLAAFKTGDYAGAGDLFVEAQAERPNDAAISLNLAAALHAQKRYDEAALAARRALASTSAKTRGRAQASLGHHRFSQGDLPGALEAFKQALIEDPGDDTSRRDYEVVRRILMPPPPDAPPAQNPGDPDATPPQGTPSPASSAPQPGATGTPGAQPGATTQPGSNPGAQDDPKTPQQADQRLAQIDAEIRRQQIEAGEDLSAAEALKILQLLAERSRISALRESFGGNSDPRDY